MKTKIVSDILVKSIFLLNLLSFILAGNRSKVPLLVISNLLINTIAKCAKSLLMDRSLIRLTWCHVPTRRSWRIRNMKRNMATSLDSAVSSFIPHKWQVSDPHYYNHCIYHYLSSLLEQCMSCVGTHNETLKLKPDFLRIIFNHNMWTLLWLKILREKSGFSLRVSW